MATELIVSTANLAVMIQDLTEKANDLLAQAGRAEIRERKDYENGTDFRKIVSGIHRRLEDQRKNLVGPYSARVRTINAEFKKVRDIVDKVDMVIKGKMLTWHDEEEKRQRERHEEQRREAEEASLAAAEEAEKAGDASKAEAILNMASEVPPPDSKPQLGRGSLTGATSVPSKVWVGRVDNVRDACRAIAEGHLPEDTVVFPQSKLNALARQYGESASDDTEEIAQYGINYYRDKRLSVR